MQLWQTRRNVKSAVKLIVIPGLDVADVIISSFKAFSETGPRI